MRLEATSGHVSFEVVDWLHQFEGIEDEPVKQIGYALGRPLLDLEARRWLSRDTLRTHAPRHVFREFGFPVEARRRWALAGMDVRNAVILVQGTGSGWDVLTWARLRPRRIIATDLYAFDAWDQIARHCADEWNVSCEFRRRRSRTTRFSRTVPSMSAFRMRSSSIAGTSTQYLAESRRLLRPGGRLYAGYGPLWFCPGGDHYSGRGGLLNSYNHLVLSSAEYKDYIERFKQNTEGFQNGYRYVELDLFSKLTTARYLAAFRGAGFDVDALILELSSQALKFRGSFPQQFNGLLDVTRGRCSMDDLLIKGNLVKLTRR